MYGYIHDGYILLGYIQLGYIQKDISIMYTANMDISVDGYILHVYIRRGYIQLHISFSSEILRTETCLKGKIKFIQRQN